MVELVLGLGFSVVNAGMQDKQIIGITVLLEEFVHLYFKNDRPLERTIRHCR